MIVNGVTLPDIPADVLAEYPYAVITHNESVMTSTTLGDSTYSYYNLVVADSPFDRIPKELIFSDYDMLVSKGTGNASNIIETTATTWDLGEPFDMPMVQIDNTTVSEQPSYTLTTTVTLFWTNQEEIKEAIWIDEETGEWGTEPREEETPSRVSIGRSLMDGIANEVQRLTGITDQMNAVTIQEQLSTAKAGIKNGDVILPPIPEDVLAQYPYAVIFEVTTVESGEIGYMLSMTTDARSYCPGELLGDIFASMKYISSNICTAAYYGYTVGDMEAWEYIFTEENTTVPHALGEANGEIVELIYSNHDIYTATAMDIETFASTAVGTDIYYSERQNFNGVWLPRIPDNLEGYPYQIIVEAESSDGSHGYLLVGSTSGFGFADVSVGSTLGFTHDGVASLGTATGYRIEDGELEWTASDESSINIVYIRNDDDYVSFMQWTNHDVYEVTSIDTGTGVYTTGDLYFPPLEAIDSDRVSIGYDLFNSMVQDIQRLSGSSEQMNALHALHKLTTVTAAPVVTT